ncbi:VWA domain-containing protein [Neolewinella litorea]|uniref:VWA domain-containing protein n=1 Tax=Neolewinella litorea TaxID=2562452 RepID=A0A4S4NMK3_9BACT|nr:VWA domain-containing protein [Neolewinella litorea]THH41154.1 VWA domain-containing protein [Neolewinella litorea]
MQQDEILEAEYQRFIEFGQLLDRRTRRYLVEYLKSKLSGQPYLGEALNDRYAEYFQSALDDIFGIDQLLFICADNESITRQIVLDTLYWIKKTFARAETRHPYTSEVELLQGWSVTPARAFRHRYPHLLQFLRSTYLREELDTAFYEDRLDRYFSRDVVEWSAADHREFDRLLTDLLSQWDALLQAKILEYQLRKFSEAKESFTDLLKQKVEEYRRLRSILNPFTDYLGWDMSRDLWQSTSFDALQRYDALLADEDSLRRLADLLGNLREAEIELEEETFEKTIVRQEWVTDPLRRSEIVGIHESHDLNHILSSEAALLSQRDTETAFLKKYADHGLLTLRYEDRYTVRREDHVMEVSQRVKQREKGPFIVCVDTSQSMMGRPEEIAKVLTLGILKMAIQSNRRAYLINFSTGIKTIDLYDIANSIDELAAFLTMSFYGGTDATLALYEALRQLKANDYRDADVLMISDFVMYKIDRDVLSEVAHFQHNKGTEFHSLALTREANAELLSRFDTNWIYDPERRGIIRELTRGLAPITAR